MKRAVTSEELEQPLVPYRDALDAIVGSFAPLDALDLPLGEALGLVAAENVIAPIDVPAFENSAMDGYAVRAQDTPGTLTVVDDVPAGTSPSLAVAPGTAVTIMTGAPLPAGADAVAPWEDTERRGDLVEVLRAFASGKHVRPRGEDVAAGTAVIVSGTELRAVEIGVLASIGRSSVRVSPRPRVAILSTGDEVAEPGAPLPPAGIYDANRALLRAMCEQSGARVVAEALIGDDPAAIAGWLGGAAENADVIVTSGGASVGEHDWMRTIVERDGSLDLWRVAIKPGKPIIFGRFGRARVFGLPGNPGSAFVCTHVFVQPALRKLAGRDPAPRVVRATLAEAVRGSPSRTMFARVRLDGERAVPLPAQSSVVLSNIMAAHGFAVVPPGGAQAGSTVDVELL
ncbi:MAG: gephyrin-like molybdotransferase Glp [Actinomycetota bacterium]